MKINKISVNNLGIYGGQHIFDFSQASKKKPIILFGGLNGAGKTTLFDGIRLCLYGKDMFEKISERAYDNYLIEKIHHTDNIPLPLTDASIAIDFEYAELQKVNNVQVKRSWNVVNGNVKETLNVYKNDIPLDDVSENSWQDFINEMIPIGVSQLFFFDGEKIKNIIADNSNTEFANSVKSLLGIDIIERLQADIKIYQMRNLRDSSSEKEQKLMKKLEDELLEIEKKISSIRDVMASIENDIQKAHDEQKVYKNKFTAEGGSFFKQLDTLKIQKNNQELELEHLREQLRDLAAGILPVLIAKKLAFKLKLQLQNEEKLHIDNLVLKKINEQKVKLCAKLNSPNNKLFNISKKDKAQLFELINACFAPEAGKSSSKEKELFGYSVHQINNLISIIDDVDIVEKRLMQLTKEYEQVFRKLQKTEKDLAKAPAEDLIKVMYDKLVNLTKNLETFIVRKNLFQEKVTTLEKEKEAINLEYSRICKNIADKEKHDQKLRLTFKVNDVLDIYKKCMVASRIEQLQNEFITTFNGLHRKGDVVNKIKIDPVSLSISMFDKKNKEIPIDNLSSGEKEIYAIALLSSLAKTSNMNLPFIIDTPLGRLDNHHRGSLVKKFFPNVSHQMIIFSTDTEIGEDYYRLLKPHIACEYNLDYSNNEKKTKVKQGYFWA